MPPLIGMPGLRAVWRVWCRKVLAASPYSRSRSEPLKEPDSGTDRGGPQAGQPGPGSGLNDLFVGVGGGCSAGSLGLWECVCVCVCVCVRVRVSVMKGSMCDVGLCACDFVVNVCDVGQCVCDVGLCVCVVM